MNNNDQEIAGRIYRYGCLALCYIKIGAHLLGIHTNPLADLSGDYNYLVKNNIMDENCYVNDAASFLETIFTGHKFSVTKTTENPKDGWVICTNNTHFVIVNERGEIVYNPLGESNNKVWYSKPPHSYRVVTPWEK